ncbi:MAG: hypothetical protein H7831_15525 [Magnetococcus sp. WYHC-3]
MLIIEFYQGEKKVAECKSDEVFSLTPDQQRNFWTVQDDRERSIKLKLEEGEK